MANGGRPDPLGPLTIATVLAMVIVAVIALVDLSDDGKLDPAILGILGGTTAPVIAVFVARYRRNGHL